MRITGWHVDGFGILRDQRVEDLSAGLTVFYGPNEAGKSTLLAFLRGVLFGFPDGRSSLNRYPPVGGGPHGGRLFLSSAPASEGGSVDPHAEQRVVVERFAGRGRKVAVTLEDGRSGDAADLAERLGHVDGNLYRRVFAFGLGELQQLETLSEAGIQDHLFSAGTTGTGGSARQAIRRLHDESRALWAGVRSRKASRAKELIEEIAGLQQALAQRRAEAAQHPGLLAVERELEAEIADLRAAAARRRREARRAEQLVLLWSEIWSPLAEARQRLAKLGPIDALPADMTDRLEDAQSRVRAAEDRLGLVRDERTALAGEFEDLALDESAHAVASKVETLHERLALVQAERARASELVELLSEYGARVAASLARLGEPFDEARLLELRPSLARREEQREWKAAFDQAAAVARAADAERRLLGEQLEGLEARCAENAERLTALDQPDLEPAEIQRRSDAARALRAFQAAVARTERELELRAARLAQHEASGSLLPRSLLLGTFVSILAVVAGAGLVMVGRFEWALAGAFAALAWASIRLAAHRRERRAAERSRELAHEELLEAGRDAERLREAMRPHLDALGLDHPVSEEVLDACEQELAEERERLVAPEALRLEASQLAREVAAARRRLAEHDATRAGSHARERDLASGFAAWKREVGLPEELSAEAAGEFLEEARRARDAVEERDRLASEHRRVTREVAEWDDEVQRVVAAAGGGDETPRPDDPVAALLALRARCERDRAARELREPLERRASELRERFVAADRALAAEQSQLGALLRDAGVETVDGLRTRLQVVARARDLRAQIERWEGELARRLEAGSDAANEAAEDLLAELETGRTSDWEAAAAGAKWAAAELDERRDEVLRRHQDARVQRVALETSIEVAEIEQERAALEQELREVVDEWRHLQLAKGLLERALERFESEHQPGVLREAARLFAKVTAGRYPRVVQSEGPAGFAVVDRQGRHRSPDQLSTGTTEQLYLCVRLGLVAELARGRASDAGRPRSLPVVMDDVLVNFDDERAAAMASVLGEFASDHQLFFFTCSSRTRDLLAAGGPAVDVRTL